MSGSSKPPPIALNLPNDAEARARAQEMANKTGRKISVADDLGRELFTVGPALRRNGDGAGTSIRSYLEESAAFEPAAIHAMSQALEDACACLKMASSQTHEREFIAQRIVDLARAGVLDAADLSTRVVAEAQALRSM